MPTIELTQEEIESLIKHLRATNQGVTQVIRDAETFKIATPSALELIKGDLARRQSALGKLEAALRGILGAGDEGRMMNDE